MKGKKILSVQPEALTLLAENAFVDVAHLLRPAHLQVSVLVPVQKIYPCAEANLDLSVQCCSLYVYACVHA